MEEKKAVERGKEDKMLKGRLLGKRGREDGKDGVKKRAVVEEESEEEEGRSGLGRKKRKMRRVVWGGDAVQEEEVGEGREGDGGVERGGDVGGGRAAVDGGIGAEEPIEESVAVGAAKGDGDPLQESVEGKQEKVIVAAQEPTYVLDATEVAAEKKRKRKQAKRKRSKANKAAQELAGITEPQEAA